MSQVIEHTGRIQRIDGNRVQVLITQHSACSGCHAKAACTAADAAEKVIEAETDDATLQVGDTVTVCAQRSTGMLAVLLAFVIPFLLILLVLVVLRAWIDNEPLTGTLALASLIPYYMIFPILTDNATIVNDFLRIFFEFFLAAETDKKKTARQASPCKAIEKAQAFAWALLCCVIAARYAVVLLFSSVLLWQVVNR